MAEVSPSERELDILKATDIPHGSVMDVRAITLTLLGE